MEALNELVPPPAISSTLFKPISLRGVTFPNRLWVAPMCQYSAGSDGVPTDWHLVHLGSLSCGGPGLLLTEATAVVPEGRISPQDLGLWNNGQRDAFERIVSFVHGNGVLAGVQLAHAGRKASTYRPWAASRGTVPPEDGGWATVGPSALPFGDLSAPRELTRLQIADIVTAFAAAAHRAVQAGFDVIELHGAHGYLIHQFLSPISNRRSDDYGGTPQRRARFLLDVVRAVRAEIPSQMPLLLRLTASDWVPGGFEREDAALVAKWVVDAGVDFLDISTGGLDHRQDISAGPLYQVPHARYVRDHSGIPTSAVGLITTSAQAEELTGSDLVDVIMMGREMLRDPHFPLRAARELGAAAEWAPPYERARLPT